VRTEAIRSITKADINKACKVTIRNNSGICPVAAGFFHAKHITVPALQITDDPTSLKENGVERQKIGEHISGKLCSKTPSTWQR